MRLKRDKPARYASRWGRRLASLAEGRGLSVITVSGLRPRDARLISFTRVLVVGQRFFSVGLGGAPSSAKAMEDGAAPRESCASSAAHLHPATAAKTRPVAAAWSVVV